MKPDRYWSMVIWRKITRPWCPSSKFGGHTMVEYQSAGTKKCADCQYTEPLYIEVD